MEKQIEEIMRILNKVNGYEEDNYYFREDAEQLYKQGYRKVEQTKQEVAREIFEEIKQKRKEYWNTGKYTMFKCWCKAEDYVREKYIGEVTEDE